MTDHSPEHHTFADEGNRRVKIQIAVSRVLEASAVKHQGTREEAVNAIIAKISRTHNIRVADRGWVVVEDHNGIPVDLTKLVQETLLLDKNLSDPDSVAHAVREGKVELGAKDELTTARQKSDFIARYGYDAWSKLPTHRSAAPVPPSKEMTRREYMEMSMRDRIQFQKTITEQELGQILSRR
jgi:hypothetical protein